MFGSKNTSNNFSCFDRVFIFSMTYITESLKKKKRENLIA